MKKKILILLGLGLVLGSITLQAEVGPVSWNGTNSWTYNKEIMGDKPGDQWDTQKTDQEANPVKWVLHKSGGNPVIWLRIDDTVSSWDPAKTADDLKTRFTARGITVDAVQRMTINGNDVYVVSGLDRAKDARLNTAIFWRQGTKRAYQLELIAPSNEFSTYEPAHRAMIQTIKLIP